MNSYSVIRICKLKVLRMRKVFMICLLSIFALAGCKKEDAEKTTEEKIIGLWLGVENYYEETQPGQSTTIESEDLTGYNFNFKANGTLVMDSAGFNPETVTWSVTSDNKLVWGYGGGAFDVLVIARLTDTQFYLEETGTYSNTNGDDVPYKESLRLKK